MIIKRHFSKLYIILLGCRKLEFPPKYTGRKVSPVEWRFCQVWMLPWVLPVPGRARVRVTQEPRVCGGTCGLGPGAHTLPSTPAHLFVSENHLFSWSHRILSEQNWGEKHTDFSTCAYVTDETGLCQHCFQTQVPTCLGFLFTSGWKLPLNCLSYLALRLQIDPHHVSRDLPRRWHIPALLPVPTGLPSLPHLPKKWLCLELGCSCAALGAWIPPRGTALCSGTHSRLLEHRERGERTKKSYPP